MCLSLSNLFKPGIMDNITKLWSWLKSLPVWLRAVVLLLVGILALIFSVSCSTMSRVIVKETTSGVSITTSQSADKQNNTSIQVNPTLNFSRNVPEN